MAQRAARAGRSIEALDPLSSGDTWHAATVDEVRQGVSDEGLGDDGLRLWVRYEKSGLCQWLRRHEVRPRRRAATATAWRAGPTPQTQTALTRTSLLFPVWAFLEERQWRPRPVAALSTVAHGSAW